MLSSSFLSNLTVADSFPRSASAERQPIVHVFHESLRNFTVEREPGNVQTNELVYYDAYGTPTSGSMAAFLPTNAEARLTRRRTMFRSQETSASSNSIRASNLPVSEEGGKWAVWSRSGR